MRFLNMFLHLFSWNFIKKYISWILIILALFILFFLFRSFYHPQPPHNHIYLIGRDSTWYSIELLGRQRNLSAFTNDLFTLMGKESGLHFQWVETSPNNLLAGLDSENYNGALSPTRPTVVNDEKYLFSELIFELGPVLIVPQDSSITSLKQMKGKAVGIKSNTPFLFNAVRERGANVYDFMVITYENINTALKDLVNNQIDGVIIDALPAYTLTNSYYAGQLKVVTPPFTDEGLRLVTLKNPKAEEMIEVFNKDLTKLKENGTYDALITKWSLIDAEKQFWHKESNTSSHEN